MIFIETPFFEEDIQQLENQILMLLVYKKARQEDLTPAQKRALRNVVENWNG